LRRVDHAAAAQQEVERRIHRGPVRLKKSL
jgi:hypothetical protein